MRTTSHGIAATVGKVGAGDRDVQLSAAAVGFGLPGPMWVAGASCSRSASRSRGALLPEPNGLDLEEASRDKTFEGQRQLVPAGAS